MSTLTPPAPGVSARPRLLSRTVEILNSLRADRVFLAFAIPFGLLLIAFTPPFQVPDEPAHYFRAYAISNGQFLAMPVGDTTGNILPASLRASVDRTMQGIPLNRNRRVDRAVVREELSRPLRPAEREPVGFAGAAVYFPTVHAPQATGMFVARVLEASPLWIMYAGRFTNFVVALLLTLWAIRITPAHRWLMTLLALTPMNVFLRSSLSADALTTALALLFVALVLRETMTEPGTLSRRRVALIVGVAILLGLCKVTYFLMAGAFLLVPLVRFGSHPRRWATFFFVVAVSAVPALAWSRYAAPLYRPRPPGQGPDHQLAYVLSQPFEALKTILHAPVVNAWDYLSTMVGRLGWMDAPLPTWVIVTVLVLLGALALIDRGIEGTQPRPLGAFQRGVSLLLFVAGMYAVCASLYLAWTPVGARFVEGVQGRYFLPLLPLLFLGVHLSRAPGPRMTAARNAATVGGIALGSVATVVAVYGRYYA